MMLWHRYMISILEWTRGLPAIVMSYSKVLADPRRECERLAKFLTGPESYPDPAKAAARMKKSVDGKLRHCQAAAGLLTRRQRNLQESLEWLADSGDIASVDLRHCGLPPGWRGFLRAHLLLMRCQQRWNRLFPCTSQTDALAASYARGLGVLDVNTQFSSHNGVLLDSNISMRR
jgi:hypothetical protein